MAIELRSPVLFTQKLLENFDEYFWSIQEYDKEITLGLKDNLAVVFENRIGVRLHLHIEKNLVRTIGYENGSLTEKNIIALISKVELRFRDKEFSASQVIDSFNLIRESDKIISSYFQEMDSNI